MKYEKPNMELVNLEVKDIITESQFGDAGNGTYENDKAITTPPDWGN